MGRGIVSAVTLKTGFGVLGVFGSHFLEVLRDIDFAKIGRHAYHAFVTNQTKTTVFGNKEILICGEVTIPGNRRFHVDLSIVEGLLRERSMGHRDTVAVNAKDRFVPRIGPFLGHLLVTGMTNIVGGNGAGLRCNFLQRLRSIRPLFTKTDRYQSPPHPNRQGANRQEEDAQSNQMPRIL